MHDWCACCEFGAVGTWNVFFEIARFVHPSTARLEFTLFDEDVVGNGLANNKILAELIPSVKEGKSNFQSFKGSVKITTNYRREETIIDKELSW